MATTTYRCLKCNRHFTNVFPVCIHCKSEEVEEIKDVAKIKKPIGANSANSKTAKAIERGWVSSSGIVKAQAAEENTVYFKVPPELKAVTSPKGLPKGSLYFLYGSPGIGKSTIVISLSNLLLEYNPGLKILIISSEESVKTVGNKIIRIAPKHADNFDIIATNSIYSDHIATDILAQYDVIMVDSISAFVESSKEVATILRQVANNGSTVIMIGHVVKSGSHEGPNTLAHIVDAEWSCFGDRISATRALLMPKSRFCQTGVIFYELTNNGIKIVEHESSEYLMARQALPPQPGSVLSTLLVGNRFVPVDIQVSFAEMDSGLLIASTNVSVASIRTVYATAYRFVKRGGIVAVQINGIEIGGFSAYNQPDISLPLAIAMISSAQQQAIPPRTAVVGNLDLSGRVFKPMSGLLNRVERLSEYTDLIYGPADAEVQKQLGAKYVPVRTVGDIVQKMRLEGEPRPRKYKNRVEAELAEGTPDDDGLPEVSFEETENEMFETD